MAHLWRGDFYGEARAADVHVQHIRGKIEPDPKNPHFIETVRGAGYRFAQLCACSANYPRVKMNGGSKPTLVAGCRPRLDRLTQLRKLRVRVRTMGFWGGRPPRARNKRPLGARLLIRPMGSQIL